MTEVASHRGSCGGGPDRASVVLPRQAPTRGTSASAASRPPLSQQQRPGDAGALGELASALNSPRPLRRSGCLMTRGEAAPAAGDHPVLDVEGPRSHDRARRHKIPGVTTPL